MHKTIAFIGSVGIPNRYGGFESFIENVAPIMAKNDNTVYVTCYHGAYTEHYEDYENIKRIFIKLKANGPLSPLHDMLSFLKVFKKAKYIIVLGVSAGPFFALMRFLSYIHGNVIITNIDGVEWRRNKYSKLGKFILFVFDYFAQIFSNKIIYDNAELMVFIKKYFIKKSFFIPYSGDHVLKLMRSDIKPRLKTALTICRVEPENNIEMLIEGFLRSSFEKYVIIGNFNYSNYGRTLSKKYENESRIELLNSIYDAEIVNKYRQLTCVYLHGHSVGGTNPSLVEMLFHDCAVFCYDCNFNRATAGLRAHYFSNCEGLMDLIDNINCANISNFNYSNKDYFADNVAGKYLELMD